MCISCQEESHKSAAGRNSPFIHAAADFSYEYNHVIQTITVNVIMRNGKNCTIIMNSIYVTNRYKKTINQSLTSYKNVHILTTHTDSMSMHLKLLILLIGWHKCQSCQQSQPKHRGTSGTGLQINKVILYHTYI